jgi:hypothetical protein
MVVADVPSGIAKTYFAISVGSGDSEAAGCFAAMSCFLDSFLAPKESDPGAALTAVMGILMVRRAVIVTPPVRSCDFRRMRSGRTRGCGQPQSHKHKQTDLDRINRDRGGLLRSLGKNRKTLEVAQLAKYLLNTCNPRVTSEMA